MKTTLRAAASAVVVATCAFASHAMAQTSPSIPVGSLTAFPTIVQTGTKPTLTWSISYPSIVQNYVTITNPATVTPKVNLVCDVRILGLGVTSFSNGRITYYRTRSQWRYNNSSTWTDIYDGIQTNSIVQTQGIVRSNIAVTKDRPMNFAGQYINGSTWQTLYTSLSGDNVRTLKSGDTPPSNVPDYDAPSLESFLKPYLDASGKVRIGPMDVIVFMELTHTDKSNIGYDLQDCVMLITFRVP
jgi:hypothetical protein